MTDQVVVAAIAAVISILAIFGIVRVVGHRREPSQDFGAGGSSRVPVGTSGVARTPVDRSGVVYAVGEEWTARSGEGATIPEGARVRVVGDDGLTLIVEPEAAHPVGASEGSV